VTRHLLVDVSGHGYGHLAQVAPVVATLRERVADLRVTVRTSLPADVVRRRLEAACRVLPGLADVGLVMRSGLDVDVAASLAAYAEVHAGWEDRVRRAAAETRGLAADLVLADVPYLSVAAAAAARIPVVALCSLNWADIYRSYAGDAPEGGRVAAAIEAAYGHAMAFLQPRPHMPMVTIPRRRSIGPVAALGRPRRDDLGRRLAAPAGERLALVGLGGIETPLAQAGWPRIPGVRWLLPGAWGVRREDVTLIESLDLPFLDLLASSDVLVTKTGYGSFVEAACAGVPVAYVGRPDWPEEPYLGDWLAANAACRGLDRAALGGPGLADAVEALLQGPRPAPVTPTGNEEAAEFLAGLL
jgi:hypothetical protein